jgi:hypothetical protein
MLPTIAVTTDRKGLLLISGVCLLFFVGWRAVVLGGQRVACLAALVEGGELACGEALSVSERSGSSAASAGLCVVHGCSACVDFIIVCFNSKENRGIVGSFKKIEQWWTDFFRLSCDIEQLFYFWLTIK